MFTICTKDTSLQPIWTIFDQHWGTSSAGINHVSDDERESGVEPGGEPEPSPESVGDSALHGSSLDDPMPSLPDLGIPEDTWDPAARESDEEPGDLAPCAVCDKVGPHECVVDSGPSRDEVEKDLSTMRDDLLGKIKRLRLGPTKKKQCFTTNLVTGPQSYIWCHDTNNG